MYTTVIAVITIHVLLASCVTVNQRREINPNEVISKFRIELKATEIACQLNDILIISAPSVNSWDCHYYLNKPNGELTKLNLTRPEYNQSTGQVADLKVGNLNENEYLKVTSVKGQTIIAPSENYRVFNINQNGRAEDTNDTFREKLEGMKANDFMIGPLSNKDHGNWMLSMFYKITNEDYYSNKNDDYRDKYYEWVEAFQVFTVEITEYIPSKPVTPKLNVGSNFMPMFAYPIKNIKSCQLYAPKSTFDRFYDRDKIKDKMGFCAYLVSNLTKEDAGAWRIVGIGEIIYETVIQLEVIN